MPGRLPSGSGHPSASRKLNRNTAINGSEDDRGTRPSQGFLSLKRFGGWKEFNGGVVQHTLSLSPNCYLLRGLIVPRAGFAMW